MTDIERSNDNEREHYQRADPLPTGEEACWPNGVPRISDEDRQANAFDPTKLRDLIAYLWLYIGRFEEKQLTTEQKEMLADIVEGTSEQEDFEYDRWWRK